MTDSNGGDLWFDTDDSNRAYWYRPSTLGVAGWVAMPFGANAIAPGSLSMETLVSEIRSSLGQVFFDDFSDAARWSNLSGGGTLTAVSAPDAQTGGSVGRATGGFNQWWCHSTLIPFDPNETYRVTVRVRENTASANAKFYAGLLGVAANGVTHVNMTGANSTSSQFYCAATGVDVGGAFNTYVGYIKGTNAAPTGGSARPDVKNPGTLHPDVRFIRPLLITNYGGIASDIMELDMMRVEVLPVGLVERANIQLAAINSALIEDLAVVNGKIGNLSVTNAKIADLTVNDAKIANLGVGKLTAGIMTADVTISNRFKTANTGVRFEINSNGAQAYDASGNLTVSISSTDSNHLLSGTIRTGLSGARVEIAPSTGGGVARFYSGYSTETLPGTVSTWVQGDAPASNAALYLVSPKRETWSQCTLVLQSADGDGAASAVLYVDKGDLQIVSPTSVTGAWGGMNFRNSDGSAWGSILRNSSTPGLRLHSYDALTLTSGIGSINITSSYRIYLTAPDSWISINGTETHFAGGPMVLEDTFLRTSTFGANVGIASSPQGHLYRLTSSARYKKAIAPQAIPLEALRKLQPKSYIDLAQYEANGKSENGLRRYLGLIAEDVAAIPVLGKLLVPLDKEGRPDSVDYDRVAVALIPWIKDIERRVNELEG